MVYSLGALRPHGLKSELRVAGRSVRRKRSMPADLAVSMIVAVLVYLGSLYEGPNLLFRVHIRCP